MVIEDMQKQKYLILLEAILMGIPIKYKEDWDIILNKGILFENFYQKSSGQKILKKSKLTFNRFIKHYKNISDQDLKTIFGNIRLHKLQQKLIKENK